MNTYGHLTLQFVQGDFRCVISEDIRTNYHYTLSWKKVDHFIFTITLAKRTSFLWRKLE